MKLVVPDSLKARDHPAKDVVPMTCIQYRNEDSVRYAPPIGI